MKADPFKRNPFDGAAPNPDNRIGLLSTFLLYFRNSRLVFMNAAEKPPPPLYFD